MLIIKIDMYTVVHPYLVVASFLDPRGRGFVGGNSKDAKYMMLPEKFEMLKVYVVQHMMANVAEENKNKHGDNNEMVRTQVMVKIIPVTRCWKGEVLTRKS